VPDQLFIAASTTCADYSLVVRGSPVRSNAASVGSGAWWSWGEAPSAPITI